MRPGRSLSLVFLLAGATLAWAQDAPDVSLPLGPYLRPGRPLVVRVPGADRVRGPEGPWALGRGAAADEFVVPVPLGTGPGLALEIEVAGQVTRSTVDARPLAPGTAWRAVFREPTTAEELRVPVVGLPAGADGWWLFDSAEPAPAGVVGPARAALERFRTESAAGDAPLEPLLLSPGPTPFSALAAASGRSARLRGDVVLAAWLTATTLLVLQLLLAKRRERPWVRAAWAGAPATAFALWSLAAGSLPGAVRTTAVAFDGPSRCVVLVRIEAFRAARLDLSLPERARGVTLLRFSADDGTARDASLGPRVRFDLSPGEYRLLAYSLPARDGAAAGPAPAWAAELLRELDLSPAGSSSLPLSGDLPRGSEVAAVAVGSVRVQAGN